MFYRMLRGKTRRWRLRIPYVEEEDLTRIDRNHVISLVKQIDSILAEIKETGEKILRLKIQFDVNGEVDQANTALVVLLGIVKQKLEHQI